MYLAQILWLLSWPALIAASYLIISLALKNFEENSNK
jgi:hypothetical protein